MKSGLLLINKPIDWTSRDVVNKLVHKFHCKKLGHSGTLDPFASGLLLISTEKATKIVPYLEALTKTYVAKLYLGKQTDTADLNGEVILEKEVPTLTIEKIKEVLNSFLGESEQIPPMYSAVRVNGRQLYKYARNGEEIERKPRKITISNINLLSFYDNVITFECDVSKGTYIRTLGEDIAKALNTVGHLISLERTRVGNYYLKDAKTMEDCSEDDVISSINALNHLPTSYVRGSFEVLIRHGQTIRFEHESDLVLFRTETELIAIYEKGEDNLYHCKRGLL